MFQLTVNPQTNEIQVRVEDVVVKTYSPSESIDVFDELKEFVDKHEYVFNPLWNKIELEDIELDVGPMERIKGLSFEFYWFYEDTWFCTNDHIHAVIGDTARDSAYIDNADTSSNFPQEKFLSGKVTNHELRACLSDDLIAYIKNNPAFKLYYNLKEINKEVFLNETNTHEYTIPNEYDFGR